MVVLAPPQTLSQCSCFELRIIYEHEHMHSIYKYLISKWCMGMWIAVAVTYRDGFLHSTGCVVSTFTFFCTFLKATGISLGTTLQTVAGFVCAMVIAFEASWLLSVVLFFCFPMLACVGYLQIKLQQGRSAKNKHLMEGSGKIFVEATDQIRTVSSLGMELNFAERYDECLKPAFK